MDSVIIIRICENLANEAKSIADYTQAIALAEDEIAIALFSEIRNDEINHAQKLLVALSEVLPGDALEEAAQLDYDSGEGGAMQ